MFNNHALNWKLWILPKCRVHQKSPSLISLMFHNQPPPVRVVIPWTYYKTWPRCVWSFKCTAPKYITFLYFSFGFHILRRLIIFHWTLDLREGNKRFTDLKVTWFDALIMSKPNSQPKPEEHELHSNDRIPFWRFMVDPGLLTASMIEHEYSGSGSPEDPYVVTWIPTDPRNPMQFQSGMKWFYTMCMVSLTLV
jgi:hypothetical protein